MLYIIVLYTIYVYIIFLDWVCSEHVGSTFFFLYNLKVKMNPDAGQTALKEQ